MTWTLGQPFWRKFLVVLDMDNEKIGFSSAELYEPEYVREEEESSVKDYIMSTKLINDLPYKLDKPKYVSSSYGKDSQELRGFFVFGFVIIILIIGSVVVYKRDSSEKKTDERTLI